MSPDRNLRRWAAPAVGLTIGIAYLIAAWISGNPVLGLEMFAIMLLFTGGMVLAAKRSETVKGLLDGRDERITSIDLKATAFAGAVVLITIIGAFVVEIARGQDGLPYTWLGALGGVTYISAVIALRMRG
ncbi:MAG TPA: hypothetical protein VIQ02_00905 [Jiangellaceae bacterium]